MKLDLYTSVCDGQIDRRMDRWMDGWMGTMDGNGRTDRWMDGLVDGWMGSWTHRRTDRRDGWMKIDGQIDGRTRCTNARADGRTDGQKGWLDG